MTNVAGVKVRLDGDGSLINMLFPTLTLPSKLWNYGSSLTLREKWTQYQFLDLARIAVTRSDLPKCEFGHVPGMRLAAFTPE